MPIADERALPSLPARTLLAGITAFVTPVKPFSYPKSLDSNRFLNARSYWTAMKGFLAYTVAAVDRLLFTFESHHRFPYRP